MENINKPIKLIPLAIISVLVPPIGLGVLIVVAIWLAMDAVFDL